MDIVGKLPIAPGEKVFKLAMTNCFSKWIEADSYMQVIEKEVISFIRINIICRYGVPTDIVCDNGTLFVGRKTKAFCAEWNINLVTSTPRYPKANDMTTPKTSTGQTPYSLVNGCKALIPAEVQVPMLRYSLNNIEANNSPMQDNLVLTEKLRDAAKIRTTSFQQAVTRTYNKNVNIRVFREEDLVLRKLFPNKKEKPAGKLAPPWEGPYLIDSIVGQRAYKLQTLKGEIIPRSWNLTHLKLFHV
ncbi:uncharacterized protein LOC141601982 [Silene latifolia]|uniref:uncharacterized protein LOC141601982 n=1 Tax=Silene latifolia TaxID=37657 RepID=UPI003D784504